MHRLLLRRSPSLRRYIDDDDAGDDDADADADADVPG